MSNKNIKNVIHNDELYSSIFDLNNISEGLDFLTNDDSFVQVGTWKYEKGKILDSHYHNTFERKSYITQEVVLVLEGTIICNLYTTDGEFIASEEIKQNQLIIQFQGIHEYEIIKNSKDEDILIPSSLKKEIFLSVFLPIKVIKIKFFTFSNR